MGFWQKLFGSKEKPYVDETGIYFYARCDHCGTIVRVRANRQSNLSRNNGGFVWHKTIVDNRCFRRMQAVVHFDGRYAITSTELSGGVFVTEEEYKAQRGEA